MSTSDARARLPCALMTVALLFVGGQAHADAPASPNYVLAYAAPSV